MGQAKQRGTQQERLAQAQEMIEARRPKVIICNHCKAEITNIEVMESRGMRGIDGAYAGRCNCGHVTWAMAGNSNAVANAMLALQDAIGEEGVFGSTPLKRQS